VALVVAAATTSVGVLPAAADQSRQVMPAPSGGVSTVGQPVAAWSARMGRPLAGPGSLGFPSVGAEADTPASPDLSSTGWKLQQTATVPNGALSADSCTGAKACTAVGWYQNDSSATATLAEAWNGTAWSIQSSADPAGATSSELNGVSCTGASACTAVGSYRDSSGTTLTLAEAWNGTTWKIQSTPSPGGDLGTVLYAVSCHASDDCTAVGSYFSSQVGEVTLAEAWNGTSWSVQKTPDPVGEAYIVLDGVSCSAANACTAVGQYDSSPSPLTIVAVAEAWNGTTWKIQTIPKPAGTLESPLDAVSCRAADACTAVGSYQDSSGVDLTLAEAWNGTAWKIQKTPNPGANSGSVLLGVSCSTVDACTAAGFYISSGYVTLAETWNGTAWSIQSTPSPVNTSTAIPLEGVSCSGADACTAAGSYDNQAGSEVTLAEAWNGTSWKIQKTANPTATIMLSQLSGTSCSAADTCTAVGYSGDDAANLAEAWNGTTWTVEGTPNSTSTPLSGVSCTAADACTAVGYSGEGGATLAERWNGTTWTRQNTPTPAGTIETELNAVSCSAAYACTAVGLDEKISGEVTLAEAWNGTVWSTQKTPKPTGATASDLNGVSCTGPKACTAVGWYTNSSGYKVTLAEVWNGTAWSIQATPNPTGDDPSGELDAVSCSAADACTAVGGNLVERWNGTAWSIESTPDPAGSFGTSLDGVSCKAGACTAVGSYYSSSDVGLTLAETWSGGAWTIQHTPNPAGATGSELDGVSCNAANTCTAVGLYDNSSGVQLPLAEAEGG